MAKGRNAISVADWMLLSGRLDRVLAGTLVQRRTEGSMSTERLKEKLARVAVITNEVTKSLEARADSMIARRSQIDKRTDTAFAPHETILDEADRSLQEIEDALRQLSNAPLDGSVKPSQG